MTNPPHFKGFLPFGPNEKIMKSKPPVVINYEEYESVRLCDFELYGQVESARLMEVSRPTFTRIYESARRKVAQAFVEGRPIVFEGGKVYFDSEWFVCKRCGCFFNHLEKELKVANCALCGSSEIGQYAQGAGNNSTVGTMPPRVKLDTNNQLYESSNYIDRG